MTGTVLSQLINIVCVPFLARIYSPTDYGIAGAVMSITTILAAVVTLSLQNSIILAKEDEEAERLAGMNLYLTIATSLLAFIVLYFSRTFIAKTIFKLPEIENWLLIVPLYMAAASCYILVQFLANRKQYYKAISISRLVSVITNVGFSFFYAVFLQDPTGLIIGMLLGQIAGVLVLLVPFRSRHLYLLQAPRLAELFDAVKRYKRFPLYSMPADLVNVFTSQLPLMMISHYAGANTLGQYNVSNRILGLPAVVLSGAVTDVFRQRATNDYFETGSFRPILIKTAKTLASLSILPFAIIAIFGPQLFSLILGAKWYEAGVISQLLAIMYLFRFVISPITYVIYIRGKNWFSFIMDVLGFIGSFAAFRLFIHNIHEAVVAYSLVYVSLSTVTFLYCYHLSKQQGTGGSAPAFK